MIRGVKVGLVRVSTTFQMRKCPLWGPAHQLICDSDNHLIPRLILRGQNMSTVTISSEFQNTEDALSNCTLQTRKLRLKEIK